MEQTQIERVDAIPLILTWLQQMRVAATIDALWQPHPAWEGLSYGQLAVLFLTYMLQQRNHRLSAFGPWVAEHRYTLAQVTGWMIPVQLVTDDHVGLLIERLGEDPARITQLQRDLGQHLIHAYALPTAVARYDTTTVNVTHAPPTGTQPAHALLHFGYSKDRRPDLLQFKQALGTLDPAGVPLLTATLPGETADDPLYLPAWRELVRIIGHPTFLFVADCKAASIATRAMIAHDGGAYLFPLPLTGEVPDLLRAWVLHPPITPVPITFAASGAEPRQVGEGFGVARTMTTPDDLQPIITWTERWLVIRSTTHAQRQQTQLMRRIARAEMAVQKLRVKAGERATDVATRVAALLAQQHVTDLLHATVTETATIQRRYQGKGRPSTTTPYEDITHWQVHVVLTRNEPAIAEAIRLAGWRIYVTNTPAVQLTLDQAVATYRDEWTVEHGFHRWKAGSLPALPLLIRIPTRIVGLLLLLFIALQALTLLEWVARRSLAQQDTSLAGLVPGNPNMQTPRPTAERLLAQFTNLHLFVQQMGSQTSGRLIEALTPLQRHIITLLQLPPTIYDLTFTARAAPAAGGSP